MLVDLSGGDVVIASERDVEVSFVVSKIQIHLSTIVEDKHLSVSAVS